MSISETFSFAFIMLVFLDCASSLHGGIVKDPSLKQSFLVPGFYATHFAVKKFVHAQGDSEHFADEKDSSPLPKVCNF